MIKSVDYIGKGLAMLNPYTSGFFNFVKIYISVVFGIAKL